METLSIFDFMPEAEAVKFKPIKSTDWKWSMADDYPKEKNGLKVFSCFACGGGSTMGYKLAGCEVLGCVEIDPRMNEVYKKNHNPKYNYCMDIRDFNSIPNEELPPELFDLDILDGSPPCTTFSMAGDREESWGKKKKFREGQAEQTLDDLSFIFIDTVEKLKPKCVIMENVEGLIKGEAWSYVQRIYKQLIDSGYKVKHWVVKGEHMGVPQSRHRTIFVAVRNENDVDLEHLDMSFNYEPITYGAVKSGKGDEMNKDTRIYKLLCQSKDNDKYLSDVVKRIEGKESLFNYVILQDHFMFPTLSAGSAVTPMRGKEKTYCTCEDMIHAQTFPEDYDFIKKTRNNVQYICGMSVPPVMMKRVVTRLIEKGVFDYKLKKRALS